MVRSTPAITRRDANVWRTVGQLWRGDRIGPLRAKIWAVPCYLVENRGAW